MTTVPQKCAPRTSSSRSSSVPGSRRKQWPIGEPLRRVRARAARMLGSKPGGKPALWEGSAGVDDPLENLSWNRRQWGDATAWRRLDKLGYQWGGGFAQTPALVATLADKFLRPYLGDRYDLAILEISPGGGRFTAELVRYAQRLSLVDLNAAA